MKTGKNESFTTFRARNVGIMARTDSAFLFHCPSRVLAIFKREKILQKNALLAERRKVGGKTMAKTKRKRLSDLEGTNR